MCMGDQKFNDKINSMARLNSTRYASLTDSIISLLQNKGIYTDFHFIEKPTDILTKITGLSFKTIVEMKKEIYKFFRGKINNASKLLEDELSHTISTGIFSLDRLLKGGLHPKQFYEFCGVSSSGKTQLCLTIATCITLKTGKTVHYIDTKGDFSAMRIQTILETCGCSDEEIGKVMIKIKLTQVKNINELLTVLHHLTRTLKSSENESNTELLVIDSLPALFLASNSSHDTTYSLSHLRNMCRFITSEYNVSIIATNLVTQWQEEPGIVFKEGRNLKALKPSLGKFWLHVPNTRLLIEQEQNEERKITVWKSFDLQAGTSCVVKITDVGIN